MAKNTKLGLFVKHKKMRASFVVLFHISDATFKYYYGIFLNAMHATIFVCFSI